MNSRIALAVALTTIGMGGMGQSCEVITTPGRSYGNGSNAGGGYLFGTSTRTPKMSKAERRMARRDGSRAAKRRAVRAGDKLAAQLALRSTK